MTEYITRLYRVARRLRIKAFLAYVYIKTSVCLMIAGKATLLECLTLQFTPKPTQWIIKRALCFREPVRRDDQIPYDLDFIVLDHTDLDLDTMCLDESVQAQIPDDWTDWKVELRFQRGCKKRRLVVRRREEVDVERDLSRRKEYVTVSALLYPSEDTVSPVDVTDRFEKYVVVPHRKLYARDIFPMDDPDSFGSISFSLKTAVGDGFVDRAYSLLDDEYDLRESCVEGFDTLETLETSLPDKAYSS